MKSKYRMALRMDGCPGRRRGPLELRSLRGFGAPRRQLREDFRLLGLPHLAPAGDLAERALAAQAVAVVLVHHADLGAGRIHQARFAAMARPTFEFVSLFR